MLGRLGILLAVLTVGLMPATATATPRDAASTHAYLVAVHSALSASIADFGAVDANIHKLDRKYAAECPRVGVGSPQDEEAQQMSYEVAGALWSSAYHTNARLIKRYLHAVRSLSWSNPKITRDSHSYATSLRELAALQAPDLCGDVHMWGLNGFKTVPTTTTSFVRHAEAIEGNPIPLRLLAPYERPSDRALAARVGRLEVKLQNMETIRGQDWWNMLLETLGLNQ